MFTLDTTGWAVLFIRQCPLLLEGVGARQVQLQVQLQEEVGFTEGSDGVVRTVVPSRIDQLPSIWRQVHTEDVICSSSGCLLRSWLMHWSHSRMLLLLYASQEYRLGLASFPITLCTHVYVKTVCWCHYAVAEFSETLVISQCLQHINNVQGHQNTNVSTLRHNLILFHFSSFKLLLKLNIRMERAVKNVLKCVPQQFFTHKYINHFKSTNSILGRWNCIKILQVAINVNLSLNWYSS